MTMQFRSIKDLRPALWYIGISIALMISFIIIFFQKNIATIYGRYDYTGTDMMSLFGYLDLAHYRPLASQEFWGWQFFFGNLPYFLLFTVLLVGIFHLFRPKYYESNKGASAIQPSSKHYKIGYFALGIAGLIIILEIIASVATGTQTGWGDPNYVDRYYRDIPTLITEGYYVVNNLPFAAQMFISFIPFLAGIGFFPYLHGIKSFRNRGVISHDTSKSWLGWIFLLIGLLGLFLLIITINLTIQTSFTGYTLFWLIMWFVLGLSNSGFILILQRSMISDPQLKESIPKQKRGISIIMFLVTTLLLLLFSICIIAPVLHTINDSNPDLSKFQGWYILAGIDLVGIILLMVYWHRKERKDPFIHRIYFTFFAGFFTLGLCAIYGLVTGAYDNIEIAWLYNVFMPMIFITALTIALYIFGFKFIQWGQKIIGRITKKVKAKPDADEKLSPFAQRAMKITTLLVIVLALIFPSTIVVKIFSDHPMVIINNVGYLPSQSKMFFLATQYDYNLNGTFQLVNLDTGNTILTGPLLRKGFLWQQYYWEGEFTNITSEGHYLIHTQLGFLNSDSYPFVINSSYMDNTFTTGLYWYYYNRCGTASNEIISGYPGHAVCHTDDAWYLFQYPNGTTEYRRDLNLTGGYHDSGDYNVYGSTMPPLSYGLIFTDEQTANFFGESARRNVYNENASIPDIVKEAWFSTQYWLRRWYDPVQRFFDSDELGMNGDYRWTVFGQPQYEDDFANGRYVTVDYPSFGQYYGQFIQSDFGLLVTASLAGFVNLCRANHYYLENLSTVENLTLNAYTAYVNFSTNDYFSLECEQQMYEMTGNQTFLEHAINIANNIIINSQYQVYNGQDDFLNVGMVLDFAQKYNGVLGWEGLNAIQGNKTLENLWSVLTTQTETSDNFYNFLRFSNNLNSGQHNGYFLSAIMAASYAWNLTSNTTMKQDFFKFITDHFDWLYGRNFENVCMLEGVPGGHNFIYEYNQRTKFIPGRLRGEAPGYIPDGFEYFPGEPGNPESNFVIPPMTNIYHETWSDVSFRFMIANAAFFHEVLQEN